MNSSLLRRGRLRWLKFTLVGLVVALVLTAGVGLLVRAIFIYDAETQYQKLTAELDQSDPYWRWDEIQAHLAVIPPEENSARIIASVAELLPGRWLDTPRKPAKDPEEKQPPLPAEEPPSLVDRLAALEPNCQLPADLAGDLGAKLDELNLAVAEARKLVDYPKGRFDIVLADDPISTLLPQNQQVRQTCTVLHLDVRRRAWMGDLEGAVDSAHAAFNASRAIGTDPLMLSFIARIGTGVKSIGDLEHILALGEPSTQRLQVFLEKLALEEQETLPLLIQALRGERAMFTIVAEKMANGQLRDDDGPGRQGPGSWQRAKEWAFVRPVLYQSRGPVLQTMTKIVEIAPLPRAVRAREWDHIEAELRAKGKDKAWSLAQLLAPAEAHLLTAYDRYLATLRCARVAIAVELYRREHGDWPQTPAQLVPAFLPEIPTDPFAEATVRYRHLDDGVVIYSVGPDGEDNEGNIDRANPILPGTDVGFRLWDPQCRRLRAE